MTTVFLVLLTVLLVVAAAYVGLLLLRRSRPAAPAEAESDSSPQTVGELVRQRTTSEELSGDELFDAAEPKAGAAATPVAAGGAAGDDAARTAVGKVPQPVGGPATPPEGLEAGDAPWRRAARMRGDEPGAAWDTAPIPVVVEAAPEAAAVAVEPLAAEPAPVEPAPVEPLAAEPAPVEPAPVEPPAAEPDVAVPSDTPSRPLSDPEMTPLMGIPIVRPAAAEAPLPDVPPAAVPPADLAAAGPLADPSGDGGLPAPLRRMSAPRDDEEEVVSMTPNTAPIPLVATGSPQPVWFRVVRRDGEPVAAAVVSLLDPHGREVDTTKTATDGGGELRTPHGGRFLMIVSAEGFQPRAALLTAEERPVEIALLLPRSATVSGAVRGGGEPVQGATVVARQEGEVVDQTGTGPDGTFRFADLAEGVYALTATDRRGGAVRKVTLSEGADLQFDLDLVLAEGAL